jgi:Zn-dependent M28 family amino/carboxypeptidase
MKISLLLLFVLAAGVNASAQDKDLENIAKLNPSDLAVAPLRYLASDELKGRYIGREEINTAARYIAEQFKQAGAKPVAGSTGWFQTFTLKFIKPSATGLVMIGPKSFGTGTDALQFEPADLRIDAPLVYAGSDTSTLSALDLKGKLVLIDLGSGSQENVNTDFRKASSLRKWLSGKGAAGLVINLNADPGYWHMMQSGIMTEQPFDPQQAGKGKLPMIAIRASAGLPASFTKGSVIQGSIHIEGTPVRDIILKNVLAYVEGTDPKLRDQYILLTSHYDHLGVAATPQMEEGKMDSIYNGARDNATGTTAVIDAARYFGKYPPKRSVLFITYSGEEEGLLGSEYYANHPLVPLDHTVYNLNIDNASYNDTSLITLVGIHRTNEDSLIITACKAYGLSVNGDPTGGSLFYESDNAPLARKGIPAPTYSLGMRSFDSTIFNRYHRLSDEADNMDMNYVMKFIKAYILAAKYIADAYIQPMWTKNDEFEKTWQALFKVSAR